MFDAVSYVMGEKNGKGQVEISSDSDYTFNDTSGEGDIAIAKVEEGE